MQFIVILGCIVMVTLAFIINKSKLFSPIKLFFCLWTLIMVLSCIHVTKLNVPSNEAYILILLMLGSFLVKRKKQIMTIVINYMKNYFM